MWTSFHLMNLMILSMFNQSLRCRYDRLTMKLFYISIGRLTIYDEFSRILSFCVFRLKNVRIYLDNVPMGEELLLCSLLLFNGIAVTTADGSSMIPLNSL